MNGKITKRILALLLTATLLAGQIMVSTAVADNAAAGPAIDPYGEDTTGTAPSEPDATGTPGTTEGPSSPSLAEPAFGTMATPASGTNLENGGITVKVSSQTETVENGDVYTFRVRVEDAAPNDLPNINAGDKLSLKLPSFLTVADMTEALRDSFYYFNEKYDYNPSTNVLVLTFKPQSGTIVYAQFSLSMQVDLNGYDGDGSESIDVYLGNITTQPADATVGVGVGTGSGSGSGEEYLVKNIWDNARNSQSLPGTYVLNDKTKPIGYSVTIGVHNDYATNEDNTNRTVSISDSLSNGNLQLCTSAGDAATAENFAGCFRVLVGGSVVKTFSSPQTTITGTALGDITISYEGNGFAVIAENSTSTGDAVIPLTILYYAKLVGDPSSVQNSVTATIADKDMGTTETVLRQYDSDGLIIRKAILSGGNEVAAVELEEGEETATVTFRITATQYGDNDDDAPGKQIATDVLEDCFTYQSADIPTGSPYTLVQDKANPKIIHIARSDTANPVPAGVYPMTLTVTVDRSKLSYGQVAHNQVGNDTVIIRRMAKLTIDKTWLGGKDPGSGATFTLKNAAGSVVATSGAMVNGTSYTLWISAGKLTQGTANYTLTEKVAENGQYVAMNPRVISITKAEDGKITFANNTGELTEAVANEADSGKGSVIFTKYAGAKKNEQTLDGGSYQLRRVTGTDTSDLVATFTTVNGVWQSGELDYGTYFVRELSAPAGYVFDVTKQDSTPVTLSKNNKNGSAYLENELYTGGKLTVAKVDGNNAPLSGVTFTLKKGNQTIAATATGKNGIAEFTGLAAGQYTVAETVPFGYSGFNGSVAFTIDTTGNLKAADVAVTGPGSAAIEGSDITLSWVNTQQLGSLTVYKRDGNTTGKLLGGAQFTLYKVDGTTPADETTQVGEPVITGSTGESLGKAVFSNLPYGDYILKETEAPAGYDIPAELKAGVSVAIGGNQGAHVTYTAVDQTVKGKIIVKKTGANGASLAGAQFELTGGGLATGLTGVSDAKGSLTFAGLEAGTYTLKELIAPAGYVADPSPKTVVLGNTGNNTWVWEQTVTVANTQKLYTVKVVKSEADNAAKLLAGAEFTLYQANGTTKVSDPVATNSFGIAEFSNIPYGTYVLKETKAPSGYALNATPVSVVVNDSTTAAVAVGGTLTYSVGNDYTRLTVTKFEQGNTGTTLPGATFRILSGSQYVVAAPGEGGAYTFAKLGSESEATGFVTGAGGTFQVNYLPLGNYSLKEIDPPEGYELVTSAKAFSITAKENTVSFGNPMIKADVRLVKTDEYGKLLPKVGFVLTSTTDQTVFFTATTDASGAAAFKGVPFGSYLLTEDASTTPMGLKPIEPQSVVIKTTQTISLNLVNPRITGNIRFTKADQARAAETPAGLAGAIFVLRAMKDENTLYASSEAGYYFAYAVSGSDGAVEFAGVPYGVYQLSELAPPEGYQKSEAIQYVSVGGASLAGVTTAELTDYVWYNQSLTGSVIVTKVDSRTGAELTGAVFNLLDENRQFLSTHAMNNGQTTLTISGLTPGVYYLQETQAPAEHVLDDTPLRFTVTGKETASIPLTMENDPFTGSLTIIKTDKADGTGLRGAVFAIYSKADYDANGQSAEVLYTLATGGDGKAKLSAIPYGEYAAVELTPPDGYELSAEPDGNVRFFTVSNGEGADAAISLAFANEKSRYLILISKVDLATADSAAPVTLAGATFTITDGKGFSVVSDPTGTDGTVIVAVPAMGTYYVTELTPPAGYSLDPASYSVTVDSHTGENATPEAKFTSLDKEILGSVTLKKTDEAGNSLSAEFALYRMENGAEQPVTFTQSGNGYAYAGTGAQPTAISAGEAALTGLPGGDYLLKETKIPDGFMALGNTPFTIDETNFETALSFTLVNLPHQKGVGMIKQNASGLRLAGAEFTLYKVGETTSGDGTTQVGQSVTTGAAGLAVFPELTSGSYILKETKAPPGYRVAKAEGYPFTIDGTGKLAGAGFAEAEEGSGFYLITVENPYQEHTFTLNKTSSVTGAPLSGATFRMVGGAIDQTLTVGETGSVSITLPVGEYLLSETEAPKGYALDPTGHRVVVSGEGITVDGRALTGDNPSLTLANTPENFLFRLVKQNADTAQPIGGVAFTLSQNNQVVATLVTGENGTSNTVSLAPGSYVLSETTAAPGYVKPLTSWTITVAEGSLIPAIQGDNKGFAMEDGLLMVTLANEPIAGEIVIIKTGEGGEPLANALFEVLDENGANLYFTGSPGAYTLSTAENAQAGALLRTNGDGKAVLSGVLFGGYTVKEHTPPTGYQLNESPFPAEITKEKQSITVRVPNALKKLTVTVYKAAAGTATDLLLGATFALYERVDGNDGYTLGKLLATVDTGYDGKAEFTVAYGKYVILETKAPAGYERDGTQAFVFDYDDAVDTATLEHTFHNEKSVYSIEIRKVDGADQTKGLAGAVFLVTDGRGYSTQVTTGPDGKAMLSDIAYDDYTIQEITPPKGYQLNSTVYTVKKVELTHNKAVTVTVPDPFISATVRLKKIDHESRAVISGAEFTLSDASGAVLRFEQSGSVYTLSETGAVSVIQAGEATLKGLPEGTYTLTEIKAPAGYVPLDGGRTFAVNAQNFENDIVLEVENLLRKTAVGIIKIDSVHADVRLPGAEFTLLRLEDDNQEGAVITTAVTNSTGLAVFSGLAMGSYRIRETKAPSGYQLWTNPIDFTVTAEGKVLVGANGTPLTEVVDEVFIARVSNRAITKDFTLSKVDSATGAALAGATFRLTGQLDSFTLTTGNLGTAKVTLPVGTYTLTEITAPDGYALSTEAFWLTVTENGISVNGSALAADLTLTVKNTQTGYPIRIYKTDAATGAALSGAWFAISGNGRTYTGVTEASGLTGFLTLAPGVYTVNEYRAPTGYALPSSTWTLYISASGRMAVTGSGATLAYGWNGYTLSVVNTAAGSGDIPLGDLPKTGQGGSAPMLFTGAVMMLCSFGGLLALLLAERKRSLLSVTVM